jgi:lipopolysaccharide transport system permease protein
MHPIAQEPESLPVRVYTRESALRHPGRLFGEMFRDLWASRELTWRLFVRDLSARYRQSLLGYVWAFLPPIASTATFVLLNRSGVLSGGDSRIPYPAFVMIGMFLWQVFADAIASPSATVNAARAMLSKINFPRESILLSGLLLVLFNFLIRTALLIPVFVYYRIVPPASAPLALFGVAALVCAGFSLGLLLTPAGILYTDVGNGLTIALTFWMLFTPVVYTPPSHGALAAVARMNPISPLILATREWLVVGSTAHGAAAVWVFAAAVAALIVGWLLYRLAMPILIERMGG